MAVTPENTRRLTGAARSLLLSPVIILLTTGIRLLIVTNYDVPAAVAVATSGGLTETLLGTTIISLATFLPLILLLLILLRRPILTVMAAIGTAFISPAYTTLAEALDAVPQAVKAFLFAIQHKSFQSLWHTWNEVLVVITIAAIAAFYDFIAYMVYRYKKNSNKNPTDDRTDYTIFAAIIGIMLAGTVSILAFCSFTFISAIYHLPFK